MLGARGYVILVRPLSHEYGFKGGASRRGVPERAKASERQRGGDRGAEEQRGREGRDAEGRSGRGAERGREGQRGREGERGRGKGAVGAFHQPPQQRGGALSRGRPRCPKGRRERPDPGLLVLDAVWRGESCSGTGDPNLKVWPTVLTSTPLCSACTSTRAPSPFLAPLLPWRQQQVNHNSITTITTGAAKPSA